MSKPVVLDLETKKTFRDAESNDPAKLGVSVVGVYSYDDDSLKAYFEKDFDQLFPVLEKASVIIGFNSSKFDLPALAPYYVGDMSRFPQLDILEDVRKVLGKRIALNEFAKETLNAKKSGHGLMAIDYFKEGRLDELAKYCLDDVRITRDLYEYGKKNGNIFYQSPFGRREVKVDWKNINGNGNGGDINLTLGI